MAETTPAEIIVALRNRLEEAPDPICIDGNPIHWICQIKPDGLVIRDSAYYSTGFMFHIDADKMAEIVPFHDKVNEVIKICRQWLDSVVPEGKDWDLSVLG